MPSAVPEQLADLPYGHLLQPHTGPLRGDERYDTVHFDGGVHTEAANGASFLECAFTGVELSGTKLRQARFNEVWVQGSRWVAAELPESEWQDAALLGTVLAGISAYGAVLRRVVLRQCKLESVNLRGAVLRDVVFEDCLLRDVDLGGARLTEVSFPGSTLEEVRLGGAELGRPEPKGAPVSKATSDKRGTSAGARSVDTGSERPEANGRVSVDLRGAVRLGLPDGHQGLRGALISSSQLLELAPQFAQALGITVKDR